jgi:hypothetical protein
VETVIAAGPRGRFYCARGPGGVRVALKELVFSTAPSVESIRAFEREAAVLSELSHPDIPGFRESFTDGEGIGLRLYLVQDFVEGQSLLDRLRDHRFTEDEVFGLAVRLLRILEYLETRSPPVIHRDVKPANVVQRPDGSLALVDFGAARSFAGGMSSSATAVGTFGYLPAEQLVGIVGSTSDTYALAASLVHLLARKSPADLWVPGRGVDFSSHVTLSPHHAAFLRTALALDPGRRFPSAHAARTALEDPDFTDERRRSRVPVLLLAGLAAIAAAWMFWAPQPEPAVVVPVPVAVKPPPPPRPKEPAPIPWKHIRVDERLRGASMTQYSGGHTCVRYHDLAIDDVYVARGVTLAAVPGSRYDSVLLDATFLKVSRAEPDQRMCKVHVSISGRYVHVLQEGGRSQAGSEADSSIVTFGARQSQRFFVEPGTREIRLGFGDPMEPTDVLVVDLDSGTFAVEKRSKPAPEQGALVGDITREWESRNADPDLYFLRKTARKMSMRTTNTASKTELAREVCGSFARYLSRPYQPAHELEADGELAARVCR